MPPRHKPKPKQRQKQTIAILLVLAAVAFVAILAGGWIYYQGRLREPMAERELAMRVMGEYVQKTLKPKSVLLISNPFSQMPGQRRHVYAFQTASENGLRKGLAPETKIENVYPKLRPEATDKQNPLYVDPRARTPLSFLVAEGSFDEVTRAHPECEVIVSIIGMPVDVASIAAWNRGGPPRFALFMPDFKLLGGAPPVRTAFKSGKLAVTVIPKKGAPPASEGITSDYQAEFDKRFVLLTGENIDEYLPKLFR
jgi:hypothetical protein